MGSTASESVMQPEFLQSSESWPIADEVFVCLMEPRHIAQVHEIEGLSFPIPWSENMIADELKNPLSRYVVLLDKQKPGKVVGYAGYWKIIDEGHITNVAVRPEWRGKKAGTYLMQQMMAFAFAEGVKDMTLEVRESNQIARSLYEKLGFKVEGLRKNYYEDNKEDAILMWYRQKKRTGGGIIMEDTIILAIESSCDETAVAVIKNGHEILSNVVSTQIAIHRRYGGVVPEIASRKHLELVNVVVQEALEQAKLTLDDITHIAVTYGPGLVGALLVGVATAKALAFAANQTVDWRASH